ncbi:MAG: decarboxylating 6-phosphogluconate dehydrogenase [Kurthia sp.]|nr:decarboxylating 6-phosphogluconate dehydrogenase [Candidatus Kurthia equi]
MNIAFIGFGKMGSNLALQVLEKSDATVLAYDTNKEILDEFRENEGKSYSNLVVYNDFQKFVLEIQANDIVFVLVPHGQITTDVLTQLVEQLPRDVYVIEGGNSNYKEAIEWSEKFENSNKYFLDMGTSGGIQGARNGMCAMIGGNKEAFEKIEPFLKTLCCEDGLLYAGPAGSGHFLKMVHNGIEYGMMQSIAEGFDVLENSQYDFDYQKVAQLWNGGSVIRSWLIELLIDVFEESPDLGKLKGRMNASGEAQWLVEEAMKIKTPVPIIAMSLMMRNRSLQDDTFSGKVVSALRNAFGGHSMEKVNSNG